MAKAMSSEGAPTPVKALASPDDIRARLRSEIESHEQTLMDLHRTLESVNRLYPPKPAKVKRR